MLLKHYHVNPHNGHRKVVLLPTREPAIQIQAKSIYFFLLLHMVILMFVNVVVVQCLYGGPPKGPQLKELQRGEGIVGVTPAGRLNDILELRKVDFLQFALFMVCLIWVLNLK